MCACTMLGLLRSRKALGSREIQGGQSLLPRHLQVLTWRRLTQCGGRQGKSQLHVIGTCSVQERLAVLGVVTAQEVHPVELGWGMALHLAGQAL